MLTKGAITGREADSMWGTMQCDIDQMGALQSAVVLSQRTECA